MWRAHSCVPRRHSCRRLGLPSTRLTASHPTIPSAIDGPAFPWGRPSACSGLSDRHTVLNAIPCEVEGPAFHVGRPSAYGADRGDVLNAIPCEVEGPPFRKGDRVVFGEPRMSMSGPETAAATAQPRLAGAIPSAVERPVFHVGQALGLRRPLRPPGLPSACHPERSEGSAVAFLTYSLPPPTAAIYRRRSPTVV